MTTAQQIGRELFHYNVTKLFIGGTLEGLTITEEYKYRSKAPVVGFECRNPVGGSPYRIIAVERID